MPAREELFECWAPAWSDWSAWAKPALFATIPASTLARADDGTVTAVADITWLREHIAGGAVVVDLPGVQAVHLGLALARLGLRPVPLLNTTFDPTAVISMDAVVAALRDGAAVLAPEQIPPDAPPAFLLDARRMKPELPALPGTYDNRWLVFPQDFPSARYLRENGVERVTLLSAGARPADDLAHVLLRWQEAGLTVWHADPGDPRSLQAIEVHRPPRYRWVWYRLLAVLGLRRNAAGGFGAVVPQPSSGGGFA